LHNEPSISLPVRYEASLSTSGACVENDNPIAVSMSARRGDFDARTTDRSGVFHCGEKVVFMLYEPSLLLAKLNNGRVPDVQIDFIAFKNGICADKRIHEQTIAYRCFVFNNAVGYLAR